MQLHVKGKNLEVSDSIRSYAERKLQKLDRRVHESTEVELELAVEKNPSIADSQVAEATVHVKGRTLRARETARDMKAAIDELADKLVRQVSGPPRQAGRRPQARRRARARRGPGRGGDHRELVGLFRRKQETLNEQILREAGLDPASDARRHAAAATPAPQPPPPTWRSARDARPHGIRAGPSEWDAVATVVAPGMRGRPRRVHDAPERRPDRRRGDGDADLSPLADAVEQRIAPAVPRDGRAPGRRLWGVGGEADRGRADPVPDGRALELAQNDGDARAPRRRRAERRAGPAELERLGEAAGDELLRRGRAHRRRPLGGRVAPL